LDYCTKHANKKGVFEHKLYFIEQNKHLLWNWDSWECIPIKIIKGKLIFIMLFLSFVTHLLGWKMAVCFSVARSYPDIIARSAFAVKPF
jgi:hypothetical protein